MVVVRLNRLLVFRSDEDAGEVLQVANPQLRGLCHITRLGDLNILPTVNKMQVNVGIVERAATV